MNTVEAASPNIHSWIRRTIYYCH